MANPQGISQGVYITTLCKEAVMILSLIGVALIPLCRARAQDVISLESGKSVERELAGGQRHTYKITLAEGQFISIPIEQSGIDIAVVLFGPDGKQLAEIDSDPRMQGQEIVSRPIDVSGIYRLEVKATLKTAMAGRYVIRNVDLRLATEQDRIVQEARNCFVESIRLSRETRYDEALPLAERALALREKVLGPDHPEVATSLRGLAILYDDKGEYVKAESLFFRALEIREKAFGPDHLSVADCLNDLGLLYEKTGAYEKADPLYRRSLVIRRNALGEVHLHVTFSLNNLANLLLKKGNYAEAEPLHLRVLAIRQEILGPEDPLVARALDNLSVIYIYRGQYEKAEPLISRALAIHQNNLDPGHPTVMRSVNNLGLVYKEKGDYSKAESLYKRALAARENKLGPKHPDVAQSLYNLSELYRVKDDYRQAEMLIQRALHIREAAFGQDHPDVALTLGAIGNIYLSTGDYANAEPVLLRALGINERKFGPNHRNVASALLNLGTLYFYTGNFVKAEPLYLRALEFFENSLGPEHPLSTIALDGLASLYEAKGDIPRAVDFRSRALANEEREISINLDGSSERQKMAYLAKLTPRSYDAIHLHVRSAPENAKARDLALTAILQQKGRALDAMTDSLETLLRRADAGVQDLFRQLKDSRTKLARLVLGISQTALADEYRNAIKKLEEQGERLEVELSRRSKEFRAQSQSLTLAAAQAAIPYDAALVEFFVYRPFNRNAAQPKDQYDRPIYVAYILQRQGAARWVELGEAGMIDDAVDKLRQGLRNPERRDIVQMARNLDRLLMQPIRPLLGNARRILLSPDGELNLVPFAALVDERQQYLVNRYSFHYLSSGRDLLRLQTKQENKEGDLVLSDPAYGEKVTGEQSLTANRDIVKKIQDGKVEPPQLSQSLSMEQIYFSPLPGTAKEASALMRLLPQAKVFTREQATETVVKQTERPRILHIASHGYFLRNLELASAINRNADASPFPEFTSNGEKIENPMLRAGLALEGANLRHSGEEDGILTALEASGLNLWGTKLVVLSACDSGVGEVKTGEGVFGLRRAFVLAGSESQVISLWPVSDLATRDLMVAYYRRLLRGEGRGEALRQVQLQMLRNPKRRHPYYWAGFIQSGEWANLDGKR